MDAILHPGQQQQQLATPKEMHMKVHWGNLCKQVLLYHVAMNVQQAQYLQEGFLPTSNCPTAYPNKVYVVTPAGMQIPVQQTPP
jgi:hypothetical protein